MLDPSVYRSAFQRDVAALAAAAREGLDAPVPSCPGWSVATLVSHLTAQVYAAWTTRVRLRPRADVIHGYEDLDLPARYQDWFMADEKDPRAAPPDLVDLFEQTAARLEEVLWAVAPDEPVHAWWATNKTAGSVQRRMAHETAIHRWDVQLAHGQPTPIEPEIAVDGVDEIFDVFLVANRARGENPAPGSGETYHFHRTDGPGEWLVRFAPDGPVVTREHAKGDVALRGPASDIDLFLWHRIPAGALEVCGDASLIPRYFELVPPR